MSVSLAMLGVGVALVVPMLYAAMQKKYRRFGGLFMLALADLQLAQALVAHVRGHLLLMGLYLFSGVALPVVSLICFRKTNKEGNRGGQKRQPPVV